MMTRRTTTESNIDNSEEEQERQTSSFTHHFDNNNNKINKKQRLILFAWSLVLVIIAIIQVICGSKGVGPFISGSIFVNICFYTFGIILVRSYFSCCRGPQESSAHAALSLEEQQAPPQQQERQQIATPARIQPEANNTTETVTKSGAIDNNNEDEEDNDRKFLLSPSEQNQRQRESNSNVDAEEISVQLQAQRENETQRLYYLDHVKIFLTWLVVTHHCLCAFGSCGPNTWPVTIGLANNNSTRLFHYFGGAIVTLNQSFFMSLFFLIAAYFVPSSLARRRRKLYLEVQRQQQQNHHEEEEGSSPPLPPRIEKQSDGFLLDKAKRYFIPACFVLYILFPLTTLMAQAVAKGNSGDDEPTKYVYFPNVGHAWFLVWLLVLNLVFYHVQTAKTTTVVGDGDEEDQERGSDDVVPEYAFFDEDNNGDRLRHGHDLLPITTTTTTTAIMDAPQQEQEHAQAQREENWPQKPFPSTLRRWLFGILLCGGGTLVVIIFLSPSFCTMPITVGSLVNDLFLFYVGIVAQHNGWLTKSIDQQLDISVATLRLSVILEAGIVVYALIIQSDKTSPIELLGILAAGQFCLDMSLTVLHFFQANLNRKTNWTKCLSQAAYGVYILHPLVVVACTGIWIEFYNRIWIPATGGGEKMIEFDEGATFSFTETSGWALGFGCLIVIVLSNLIVWPLAWYVRQLPGLRNIL